MAFGEADTSDTVSEADEEPSTEHKSPLEIPQIASTHSQS